MSQPADKGKLLVPVVNVKQMINFIFCYCQISLNLLRFFKTFMGTTNSMTFCICCLVWSCSSWSCHIQLTSCHS